MIPVMPILAAVFTASLLGSLHCAGMCGAFVAMAVVTPTIDGRPVGSLRGEVWRHASYHMGRLVTYAAMGAMSGAVGAAIDLGGAAAGMRSFATILAGAFIVALGVITLLRERGVELPRLATPPGLRSLVRRGHGAAQRMPAAWRAGAIGMVTTLLPCGWLYAFAITAAGTANPLLGAATMAVFWLGTLPVLLSLGMSIQRLSGPLRRRLPVLTSLLLISVGLVTLSGRLTAPALAGRPGDAVLMTGSAETERLRMLDAARVPCCNAAADAGTP